MSGVHSTSIEIAPPVAAPLYTNGSGAVTLSNLTFPTIVPGTPGIPDASNSPSFNGRLMSKLLGPLTVSLTFLMAARSRLSNKSRASNLTCCSCPEYTRAVFSLTFRSGVTLCAVWSPNRRCSATRASGTNIQMIFDWTNEPIRLFSNLNYSNFAL